MSYGEYLRKLLKNKNIRLSQLAQTIHLSSRNVLYRLFNDYYGSEKTIELTDKIINAVAFSDEEIEQLYCLAKKRVVPRSVIQSRKILSLLFENTPPPQPSTEIYQVLTSHSDWKTEIFLENICDTNVVFDINLFLKENAGADISIIGLSAFTGHEDQIARELFSIFTLAPYPCYHPIAVPLKKFNGIICFFEKDGIYKLYIHGHDTSDGFVNDVCTAMTKALYDYFHRDLNKRLKSSKPLKESLEKVSEYTKYLKDYAVISEHDSTAVNGSVGFAQIPFEYMMRMLKDSDYFGFPKESEFIQKIISTAKWRCELSRNFSFLHTQIFEAAQIKAFLQSGRACDHVSGLVSLTPQERINTLKYIIDPAAEAPPRRDFRFLKRGKINHQMTYVHGHCILTYTSASGYSKNHYNITITHPKAIAVLEDFIENTLMKEYVLTSAESQELMKQLLEEATSNFYC